MRRTGGTPLGATAAGIIPAGPSTPEDHSAAGGAPMPDALPSCSSSSFLRSGRVRSRNQRRSEAYGSYGRAVFGSAPGATNTRAARRAQEGLPESHIGKATTYARNQRVALARFPDDGRLRLDNDRGERELRREAIGRKDWLFVGSDDGADQAHTTCLKSRWAASRAAPRGARPRPVAVRCRSPPRTRWRRRPPRHASRRPP